MIYEKNTRLKMDTAKKAIDLAVQYQKTPIAHELVTNIGTALQHEVAEASRIRTRHYTMMALMLSEQKAVFKGRVIQRYLSMKGIEVSLADVERIISLYKQKRNERREKARVRRNR